jgi:hypothetical protein
MTAAAGPGPGTYCMGDTTTLASRTRGKSGVGLAATRGGADIPGVWRLNNNLCILGLSEYY